MTGLLIIIVNAALIENFVLVKFLGICPFLGVSKRMDMALGMGMAVTFTMTLSSAFTWAVNRFILERFNLQYMQTIAFVLVIAALVQLIEMGMQKLMPALHKALGIYLPLITTNCAVLGAAIINIQRGYTFVEAMVFGLFSAVGFMLAIVLFAGVRERIMYNNVPKCFQGFPITLISAALLSLAFMGFQGLNFLR